MSIHKTMLLRHTHIHRQITEYGSEYTQQMKYKLKTQGKEEYQKRLKTVESAFGTLKRQYYINKLPFTNKENMENNINLYRNIQLKKNIQYNRTRTDENKEYQTFKKEKIKYYKT